MGKFVKWVLIPAAVTAVGWFVVAPTYGDAITKRVQRRLPEVGKVLEQVRPKAQREAGASGFQPPKVEVDVREAGARDFRSIPIDPGT
jgi:hypothetical protein